MPARWPLPRAGRPRESDQTQRECGNVQFDSDSGRKSASRWTSAVTGNRASASSPIQHLLVRKTCDAINHCTVVESETGPLPVGTEAFYTGPLLESRTTSGVILTTPAGDTAKGNCSLNYNTGLGTCVFTSGTGALAGFHANLKVTSEFPPENPDGIFTWDGTYHFVGRD